MSPGRKAGGQNLTQEVSNEIVDKVVNRGASSKEVGKQFGISHQTVRNHVRKRCPDYVFPARGRPKLSKHATLPDTVSTMKRNRISKLSKKIAKLDWGTSAGAFSMEDYCHDDRSPSCIAGHACNMMYKGDIPFKRKGGVPVYVEAARYLGLTEGQARYLFMTAYETKHMASTTATPGEAGHVSPQLASQVLSTIASHGFEGWQFKKEWPNGDMPEGYVDWDIPGGSIVA